ncbi:type III polyketide synthase [Thermoactinomyces sp. CICC 10522]|jgi:alkylresorcinol/alkylpyrone synthase|uniref:type III polyketide synthase n=1 Tax=Thermoactinomyces sp. CICC 10522 TaxID=2767427 RepID=UPI0018DCBC9F|nr:3-oxoacyl-[acyl-carrier-protein] synthase III C-terminal domain-containing protein [Thermoactinomyces sp. CICC 10522]MBH8604972.1 type III polyketide synthase [Thermoactinomyces sp. CICC 10522]
MPRLIAIGTAVPEYEVKQEEVRAFAKKLFGPSFQNIDRFLTVFENAAIDRRKFCKPREWFERNHSFAEKNQAYVESAIALGEKAIRSCLDKAGIGPEQIDHLFFVSTTGMSTPSIDAHLINRLQMSGSMKRTPIWGLGCAGGVAGLARAYEYTKAFPEANVLLLAVECCGLTFRNRDQSKSNLIATSLFADGAAAVLVAGDQAAGCFSEAGPEILDSQSMMWPHSLDVMGWDVEDDGLKVVFSRDIPALVRARVRPVVDAFLLRHELDLSNIGTFIMHPGGRKVLEAYTEAFHTEKEKLKMSYEVLRDYGNMSSATVLFVLEKTVTQGGWTGTNGLMAAMGPGFSLEMVLLKWEPNLPNLSISGRLVAENEKMKEEVK